MNLENIKKKLSGLLREQVSSPFDRSIMHPNREWFIGVFSALLLLSVGVYWSVTTYQQFSNISVSAGGETPKEDLVYKEDLVKVALEDFEARRNVYLELKKNLLQKSASTPVTPSPIEEELPVIAEEVLPAEEEAEPTPEPEAEAEVGEEEEGTPDIAI